MVVRVKASAFRAEAARAREQAKRLLEYAETCDRAAAEMDALTKRNGYDTVSTMESTTVTTAKGKHRGPEALSGPVRDIAKKLGLSTLQEVADALGVTAQRARVWNHRKSIPGSMAGKVEALLAARG